ncbi:MAG: VWA domain-containing protein [Chloroflexi bacterium]|nr:VWA domain-containing protein [Chloroflexota bacterium]
MKRIKLLIIIGVTLSFLFLIKWNARADGIIIPEPPPCWPERCPIPSCPGPDPCPPISPIRQLTIRYHHVQVKIVDQIAVTHVDQVFYNPNQFQVEGTYIFPLPAGAVVTSFTLWIDGLPIKGEVLEANAAREKYEKIVRDLKDPALLEYIDQGAVQARIFPIPPLEERRIELEYSQALSAENGLVRYIYPLNTEKFSLWQLDNVSVNVDVRSKNPIRAVYSPSHHVVIDRDDKNHVSAGYEEEKVRPDKDFLFYYSMGEGEAFHLISYLDPFDAAEKDGFFLLLLAPRSDTEREIQDKDVILVLDKSGSMEGEKFQQAQEALRYILQHFNQNDRFNIIAFSTGIEQYSHQMSSSNEAVEAQKWLDSLSAEGSTDINRALLEAASITDQARPTYLIFLTDGLPTEGVVDSQQIIQNFAKAANGNLRLFAFGVGYDVDTLLLDTLSQNHHGASNYVLPGERLDESLSGFYSKISTPLLTDLELDFGGLAVYDVFPSPLPDLFMGSQVVVVGRYRQGGITTVTLSGRVAGETQKYIYQDQVFSQNSSGEEVTLSALPRLWATRKIGYLLNKIRLEGNDQETIDQIVKLSIRYGIVTPYTSYLVTEPMPLGGTEHERIAGEQYHQLQVMPTLAASGQQAVQKSADQSAMAAAEAPVVLSHEAADVVKIVGARAFVLADGIWTDTAFDPDLMETKKVAFLSDDYFALCQSRPELGDIFALGERVIVVFEGSAYEITPSKSTSDLITIPATYTPETAFAVTQTASAGVDQAYSIPENKQPAEANRAFPCIGGMLPLVAAGLIGLGFYRRS